ncbi:MAG TPA: helix-turn-helix transcriptional regulator [Nevskiaceae bacterium]|nr:helix-turn-helix transcriptional regulator [Nevskiaceae bacterium]
MADLDRLIQTLYASALETDREQFRPLALKEVCQWLGATGAAWLTRSVTGLPGEYTECPEAGISIEQLSRLNFSDGVREYVLDPLPPELSPGGKASGQEQGYLMHYVHRGGGLNSTVLLRAPRGRKLQHQGDLRRAIGHLVEAGTLSLRQYIHRDEKLYELGRASRGTAALVDAQGTIYAASTRFRELLSGEFGDHNFTALPQPLPEEAHTGEGLFFQGALHFRSSKKGRLFLLHARRPLPLDGLSPREQQIARALGTGKTFKSVARQFGIAVSTVANHASRIYRKLGIFRREELVEMVRTPTSNDSE